MISIVATMAVMATTPDPPRNHRLTLAIFLVESGQLAPKDGDGGKAVGPLQIWKITVRDANRICGQERFTYDDRRDLEKSVEMFWIVSDHYCRHFKDWSDEGRARRWACGPTNWRGAAGARYWKKVRRWLKPRAANR